MNSAKVRWDNLSSKNRVGVVAIAIVGAIIFGNMAAALSPAPTNDPIESAIAPTAIAEESKKAASTEVKDEVVTESIPFGKNSVESTSFNKGSSQVTTPGVNGQKTLTYSVTYTDGIETTRTLSKEEVTVNPITEVTTLGTYEAPAQVSVPDCNPNYSGCVPNVSYDLDCPDVGFQVQVLGYDQYRLDGNKDGWGCEAY